jgi:glycerol-3-phosphate dehydrogenase
VAAAAVVNAAGVWAGSLVDHVDLRPSRGTHLVLHPEALPGLRAALTLPVPGQRSRFVMVLPQPNGNSLVGLTDEPVDGEPPEVPEPSPAEVEYLLTTVSAALARPLDAADVVGAFAGLRPLLRAEGSTSDLSRRHAVLTSPSGVVTVVGGKLTTYRRMAQDAVDTAVRRAGLEAGPCRTARLPLTGAAPRDELARLAATSPSPRLVRRYGADAGLVLATAREVTGLADPDLLAPVADGVPVTIAELVFGVTHEGAHDVDDLLDRRTRVGLVDSDRRAAEPSARRALALAQATVR